MKLDAIGTNGASMQAPYDLYYVPFVRDSQNYVNASMVIKASATDTSFGYLCDWQYRSRPHGAATSDSTAENYALFFMFLDKTVLGHTKFQITDKNLFKNNSLRPVSLEFAVKPENSNAKLNSMAQTCVDIYVTYENCPYAGHCLGPGGSCDHCSECMSSLVISYCWDGDMAGGGGGGDSGGGSTGSGDTGSGGSGAYTGGSTPPDPCGGTPQTGSIQNIRTERIKVLYVPCAPDPGWIPAVQLVSNEIDPNASDADDIWWDDNVADPGTNYQSQLKPSWSSIFSNYPKDANGGDMPVAAVCALIGGQVNTMYIHDSIGNACALRVSRALNYAGVVIPEINGQTKKGADGKNYFLLAAHLKNWLTKTFGPPDIYKTAADGAPNGTNFRNLLMGIQNRGIYIMRPISSTAFGASGHCTLWAGLDCIGGHNFFAAAQDIFIWKLPQ